MHQPLGCGVILQQPWGTEAEGQGWVICHSTKTGLWRGPGCIKSCQVGWLSLSLTGHTGLGDLGWCSQRPLQKGRLVPRKAEGTVHPAL